MFANMTFCGENGSTYRLKFLASVSTIESIECSIMLLNCSKSTDIVMTDAECNYCAPRKFGEVEKEMVVDCDICVREIGCLDDSLVQ